MCVCVHVSKGQVCIDGKGLLRGREGGVGWKGKPTILGP